MKVQCTNEVVGGRQAETTPIKESLDSFLQPFPQKSFLYKFYPYTPTSEIPRYTIITIDTEHGKLAEEVSRERHRKILALYQLFSRTLLYESL